MTFKQLFQAEVCLLCFCESILNLMDSTARCLIQKTSYLNLTIKSSDIFNEWPSTNKLQIAAEIVP